ISPAALDRVKVAGHRPRPQCGSGSIFPPKSSSRYLITRMRQSSWLLQAEFEQCLAGNIDLLPPGNERRCSPSQATNCCSTPHVAGERTECRSQTSSTHSASRSSAESVSALDTVVGADKRKRRVVDHDIGQLQLELRSPNSASSALRLCDSSMDHRSVGRDDEVSNSE